MDNLFGYITRLSLGRLSLGYSLFVLGIILVDLAGAVLFYSRF
jgi:hypothetical protein